MRIKRIIETPSGTISVSETENREFIIVEIAAAESLDPPVEIKLNWQARGDLTEALKAADQAYSAPKPNEVIPPHRPPGDGCQPYQPQVLPCPESTDAAARRWSSLPPAGSTSRPVICEGPVGGVA